MSFGLAAGGGMHNNLAFNRGDGIGAQRGYQPPAAQPAAPAVHMLNGTPQTMAMPPTQSAAIPAPGGARRLPIEVLPPPGSVAPTVPGQPVQSLPPGTATQPGNVAATAPMPYQSFGGIAQVDPSFASPQDQQAYLQQYQQMLEQSMNPYFQQQQQQLNADLRARGIQNSGAAGYLEGNLLGQQGATLAGQVAPMVQQAFGYANQDVLSNQNAANEAAVYNANNYQQAVNDNYGAYNNYVNELLGLGGSNLGALQAAYLNSYGPSTGVQSGYNSALAGEQNIFGNVYGNAMQNQQQNLQSVGYGLAMMGGG